MSDHLSQAKEVHLRQKIKNIIDVQYEVQDNGETTEKLIDSTISFLGDRSEAGEVFLVQALDFAIEQLVQETEAPQSCQEAINYGGGYK